MEVKEKNSYSEEQHVFSEIIKKAYEKGLHDRNLTVHKLLEDLEAELKNMMVS
ncbi:hypothetical protein [Neobacillus niacini]|uniref:hypothetical protein n=1 Tax=Neobacillus niacini TaxID=86668 RepID=UPI002863DA86|nr:hypothetical protein [Neobacillus niacini]MDR7002199.1 hypothetical protein [Neobacillus niacini]